MAKLNDEMKNKIIKGISEIKGGSASLTLNLSKTSFTAAQFEEIMAAVNNNKNITELNLDLSDCDIHFALLQVIVKQLTGVKALRELDLRQNTSMYNNVEGKRCDFCCEWLFSLMRLLEKTDISKLKLTHSNLGKEWSNIDKELKEARENSFYKQHYSIVTGDDSLDDKIKSIACIAAVIKVNSTSGPQRLDIELLPKFDNDVNGADILDIAPKRGEVRKNKVKTTITSAYAIDATGECTTLKEAPTFNINVEQLNDLLSKLDVKERALFDLLEQYSSLPATRPVSEKKFDEQELAVSEQHVEDKDKKNHTVTVQEVGYKDKTIEDIKLAIENAAKGLMKYKGNQKEENKQPEAIKQDIDRYITALKDCEDFAKKKIPEHSLQEKILWGIGLMVPILGEIIIVCNIIQLFQKEVPVHLPFFHEDSPRKKILDALKGLPSADDLQEFRIA